MCVLFVVVVMTRTLTNERLHALICASDIIEDVKGLDTTTLYCIGQIFLIFFKLPLNFLFFLQ